jgi:hypothetical protein
MGAESEQVCFPYIAAMPQRAVTDIGNDPIPLGFVELLDEFF